MMRYPYSIFFFLEITHFVEILKHVKNKCLHMGLYFYFCFVMVAKERYSQKKNSPKLIWITLGSVIGIFPDVAMFRLIASIKLIKIIFALFCIIFIKYWQTFILIFASRTLSRITFVYDNLSMCIKHVVAASLKEEKKTEN